MKLPILFFAFFTFLDFVRGNVTPENSLDLISEVVSKRFVRSSKSSPDPPTKDDSSNDENDENKQSKDYSDDKVSLQIVDAICSNQKGNESVEKGNNATSQSPDSREELLCVLLKKLVSSSEVPKKATDLYLPDGYNKFEAPTTVIKLQLRNGQIQTTTKPVFCQVFLNVRGIVDVDEENGLVTLDMDLILLWTDANILKKYNNLEELEKAEKTDEAVVLSPAYLKRLWLPDIYIEEVMSLTQPTFMGNSVTVVLHPQTGVVVYRSRVLVKLACGMDFTYYPADTQVCTFTLKSFSYDTDNLKLDWILQGGTGVYLHEASDPNFNYQIISFTSNETYLDIGPASDPSTLYSVLQFTLLCRRKMTYHLVQTYFASTFFVIVTWLCFLISPDMFEVRVGIAMSTLLTLTAMFASVREETPKVSYVKAIDYWMVSSIFFIFIALAGFTITAWIIKGLKRMRERKEDDDDSVLYILEKKEKVLSSTETKNLLRKYRRIAFFIEHCGVYVLSLAYILFNIFYWSWLMHKSNYLNWTVNSNLTKPDDS